MRHVHRTSCNRQPTKNRSTSSWAQTQQRLTRPISARPAHGDQVHEETQYRRDGNRRVIHCAYPENIVSVHCRLRMSRVALLRSVQLHRFVSIGERRYDRFSVCTTAAGFSLARAELAHADHGLEIKRARFMSACARIIDIYRNEAIRIFGG